MHDEVFRSPAVARLRADLALALRAAAHHGLAEGICNHFSVALPDDSNRFLLNPRGLLWSEIQADDIVLIAHDGRLLAHASRERLVDRRQRAAGGLGQIGRAHV